MCFDISQYVINISQPLLAADHIIIATATVENSKTTVTIETKFPEDKARLIGRKGKNIINIRSLSRAAWASNGGKTSLTVQIAGT